MYLILGLHNINCIRKDQNMNSNNSMNNDDNHLYDDILRGLGIPPTKQARSAAQCAHDGNFRSRRGPFEGDGSGLLDLYDNSPYQLRVQQLRLLSTRLAPNGHTIVAGAGYPTAGEDAGYTLCLVVRPRSAVAFLEAEREILKEWRAIIDSTEAEWEERERGTASQVRSQAVGGDGGRP